MGLQEEIRGELLRSHSISDIKSNLIKRGYLEADIEDVLKRMLESRTHERSRNDNVLSTKELLDRIGYGFASQQFVNILFMLSGASLLMIGFFNAFKTALVSFLSGFIKELSRVKYIGKSIISSSGIIYGFSFLSMTIAVVIRSPWLFAISLLAGTLGIIAHGDLFMEFSKALLKNERRSDFLRRISYFGIIITALSLLAAGFVMQAIPLNGTIFGLSFIGLPDFTFRIFGHLLIFEVTAIMFILSGYILSTVQDRQEIYSHDLNALGFMRNYVSENLASYRIFSKNKKIYLLMVATVLTTTLQVIGNSYFGIYIYENFKNEFLGGFLNVAVIFVIALAASLFGSVLTKRFAKSLGEAPMLVFGTLLIALMPLTLYFNSHIYSIALAAALSVVGGSIVGVAQGLLAERLMDEDERSQYFSGLGFVGIIPIILIGLLGALVAQAISMEFLFLTLGIGLACVVMPIYFIIVLIVETEYRKEKKTAAG